MSSALTLNDGDFKIDASGMPDSSGTQVYTGTYSGTYEGHTVTNQQFTTVGPDLIDYVWVSGNTFTPVTRATFTEKVKKKIVLSLNTTQHLVVGAPYVEPEPISLPAYTFRFKFSKASYDPTQVSGWKSGSTWTQVQNATDNLWDYTHITSNWDDEFNGKFISSDNYVDIIAAGDMSGITSMTNRAYINNKVAGGTFGSNGTNNVSYIQSICWFDTSNLTNIEGLFFHCSYLTSIPALDTHNVQSFWSAFDTCAGLRWVNGLDFSSATSIRAIFANCDLKKLPDLSTLTSSLNACQYAFQKNQNCGEYGSPGITAAYNKLVACITPNGSHTGCFQECGINNPEGSAELALVASGWK